MVEIALFIAIGFLSAAFLAVLAIPALARRAMRLAIARARLQAPLDEAQARAERDMLRGQHAVEIVRLQRKLAEAEWDRALARAELGRKTKRMTQLDRLADAHAGDIDSQTRRIASLSETVETLQAESGARELALYDAQKRSETASAEADAARARVEGLETRIDRERTVNAALHTHISALEIELGDWRAKYGATAGDSADHVAELYERLKRSERAREQATLEAARQLATLAERETALAAATAARDDLSRRLTAREQEADANESELRRRVQTLSTSLATAEGALGAERAARQGRDGEPRRDRPENVAAPAGDALLRAAIADLGREFLRLRDSTALAAGPNGEFARVDADARPN